MEACGKFLKLRALYDKRAVLLEAENSDHLATGRMNRYLVVGDLHIGFEERFRGSGARIRPDIDTMASQLDEIVDEQRPSDLIINGDVKAGIERILESEWENVPKFLSRFTGKCRVSVVPGNHDGGLVNLLPEGVRLLNVNGSLIFNTLVMHGHTRPLIKYKECRRIVMGHIHPIFRRKGSPLSGHPVWAFLKVPKKSIFEGLLEEDDSLVEIVLMPSFNLELFSTGYALEKEWVERRTAPLARSLRDATEAVVLTLGGEVIGDASLLGNIL